LIIYMESPEPEEKTQGRLRLTGPLASERVDVAAKPCMDAMGSDEMLWAGEKVPQAGQPQADAAPATGLTAAEASERLRHYGPNAMPEERRHPWRLLLGKLWEPVPWMLELTIVLEVLLGRHTEAAIIGALLVFNAVLSFIQENRAQKALTLLRQRLTIQSRVLRDGRWQLLPARELVPGDVIHLRMGDISPADLRVTAGQVLLDQSALTGESVPVEAEAGKTAFAGTVVKRGEATGLVTATGARTAFGKTAELVRLAQTGSHLQRIIFSIVKYLVLLDAVLVVAVLVYAVVEGISLGEILPFALILLVASIPVALPAMFTVATALGALELSRQGVLVTHLAAIEEAAGMDILCSDKTGTITQNQLAVTALRAYGGHSENDLLRMAAAASDESTQDPLDMAILAAARVHGDLPVAAQRLRFLPFDPATKRSEAVLQQGDASLRVVKGSPQFVQALAGGEQEAVEQDVDRLAAQGCRVLAVAAGVNDTLRLVGLIALQDPPRPDSRELVRNLQDLGVGILMVTGDGPSTARAVARQVGIGERIGSPEALRRGLDKQALDFDILAGVLPEDKYHLVQALQRQGHVAGMTGDGVNDAPALKQAEVGIAVANATDVAKAAASLVLTSPGLGNIVAAVQTSRRIYQRMLTYTLNKIIKTFEIALLLSLGLIFTGTFVTTPVLIVLLMFTNDFVTMAIATDQVAFARTPDRWHIRAIVGTALTLAVFVLGLSFGIFFWGRDWLGLPLAPFQTVIFIMLVFSGQGTVYLVRERRHLWSSRPSGWLLLSSLLDILFVSGLATAGIFMAPIPVAVVAQTLGIVILYLAGLDFLKIRVMKAFRLQ
jgi:H+-transporting ATPase